MTDDFKLIAHKFADPITIYPIADVHYGALEHCSSAWTQFVRSVAETPNVYIMLCGDLVNNSIRNSVSNPFDEIVRPMEQKRRMVEFLSPIRDRILCAVSGNHEYRTIRETDNDITYDIMSKLDLEDVYRPNVAFVKIGIGERNTEPNKAQNAYTFAVTHGTGGGIYTGSAVNRNERFGNIVDGLDCLVVGHTHKGTVTRPQKIVIDAKNNQVRMESYLVVSCVSWLNYGGYAMRKMLLPSDVCNPQKLILSGVRHGKKIDVVW